MDHMIGYFFFLYIIEKVVNNYPINLVVVIFVKNNFILKNVANNHFIKFFVAKIYLMRKSGYGLAIFHIDRYVTFSVD